MNKLAVLTSGGDAPGMNSAIRALAKLSAGRGTHVLGVEQGYEGLVDGRFVELTHASSEVGSGVAPKPEVDEWVRAGGTVLGSSRSARFRTPEGRAEAARKLRERQVDALVVIGGNGSLTGAHLLAQEHGVQVMGMPASIDNDVGCTGMAIGVDTALNTICGACDRIADTALAHRRAFVVEVMGRDSGYLAMAGAIAVGAEAALFREQGRTEEQLVARCEQILEHVFARAQKRRALILKAEAVQMPCTRLARQLQDRVSEKIPGLEVRATVLGHVVRGGNPSYQDRMVSGRLALAALDALEAGATDEMVAWLPTVGGGEATDDPVVRRFPLEQVLEETRRLLDGTSELTRWRVRAMERVEGVLGL